MVHESLGSVTKQGILLLCLKGEICLELQDTQLCVRQLLSFSCLPRSLCRSDPCSTRDDASSSKQLRQPVHGQEHHSSINEHGLALKGSRGRQGLSLRAVKKHEVEERKGAMALGSHLGRSAS